MSGGEPIITRIVIRRNRSLGFRGFSAFLVLSCLPQFAFLIFASIAGWWPMVGFVGASFLLLVLTLYTLMTAAAVREVISVGASRLAVEYGRGRPDFRVELERYWTRVERGRDRQRAVLLCFRGTTVEVGRALTPSERDALARRLRELVGPATPTAASAPERSVSAGVGKGA